MTIAPSVDFYAVAVAVLAVGKESWLAPWTPLKCVFVKLRTSLITCLRKIVRIFLLAYCAKPIVIAAALVSLQM